MVRIIIADDHSLIRAGLKQVLAEYGKIIVEEAENGSELIKKLNKCSYDAVILDISMPGKNGIEVMKDVKFMFPNIPVIILSVFPEDQYALRALKAGASAYLTKDSAPENLVSVLKRVLGGEKYIPFHLAEKLLKEINGNQDKSHNSLSDREFQVMKAMGHGKRPTEIAEEMFLSVKTISTYRTRILKKIDLKSNADIIEYVIKNKL